MRMRTYYVIYMETLGEVRYHSRTRDRTESARILDSLLKSGVKAWCQKEYE